MVGCGLLSRAHISQRHMFGRKKILAKKKRVIDVINILDPADGP
jgi:hypothetical protein